MSLPLIAELKRRRVFRALIAYAIVAFAVLQVVEPVMHGFRLPEWTLSFVVIVLSVGFPVTLVLAWVFDISAGRIERTVPVRPEGIGTVRLALIVAGATLAALVPAIAWQLSRRTAATTPAAPSVAVLPFVNMSPSRDDEYFSDGITEEVINALANVEGLRVVSRTSAFAYKNKNVSVRQIGEELAVATVLEGSVRREGNALRLTAQLINVTDGYHLWSKTYDRELKSVFALEDEVARAIAEALKPLLKQPQLVQQATGNTEAHDLYLKGRHLFGKRTTESLQEAMGYFEKAIAVDSRYALAYAGMADSLIVLAEYTASAPADALSKAKPYAYRALELSGDLAEAHASLGLISLHDFDWEASEREFKRAIELRSGYATAHHWYALLLVSLGRLDEAVAEGQRAMELDPASPIVNNMRGVIFIEKREYDRAIAAFQRALELNPDFGPSREMLACAYALTKKPDEALAQLDQIRASRVEHTVMRAWILAMAGNAAEARRLISGGAQVPTGVHSWPAAAAALYANIGDTERAFALLDKAYAQRDWMLRDLKVSPMWDPLRNDPRFARLLKQMRLD